MSAYDQAVRKLSQTRLGGWLFVNVLTHLDRRIMRWTNGRVSSALGTSFQAHALLLTSIGAKSGRERDIPLVSIWDGDDIILIASQGGRPKHPAWYHNLKAHSECVVRMGGRRIDCTAHEAEGTERERLWRAAADFNPAFDGYAARAGRRIPVMVLTPSPPRPAESSLRES